MSLTHVTHNVWMYPYNNAPNVVQATVGVVIGHRATLLIDAGNSPELARTIQKELRKINAPPVSHIVYTHHHWDHVFGAYVFPNVTVIAHEQCRQALLALQTEHIDADYVRLKVERNPDLQLGFSAEDWQKFHFVLPHIVFSHTYRLEIPGATLELLHVGGKHAADSIAVKVVGAGVVFLGDSYYPPPAYQETPDASLDIEVLGRVVDENYHLYIDAHKPPYTRKQIERIVRSHHKVVGGIGKV